MRKFLIKILVGIVCELMGLLFLWASIQGKRADIIELGYRSQKIRYKKEEKLPLWDKLIHWSLCKNAKINTKIIWLYFLLNFCLVIIAVFSVISLVVCMLCFEIKEVLIYQLQFFLYTLLPWEIISFYLDIFFLPSEQKRHGLKSKQK